MTNPEGNPTPAAQPGSQPSAQATTPPSAADSKDQKPSEGKVVPEADLLAIKSAKEGLEKKLKDVEDTLKTKLSETENKLLSSEAKLKELEGKLGQSNLTAAELAKAQAQVTVMQGQIKDWETKSLDLRRKMIAVTHQIPIDSLANKSLEQLDMYEEAIKTVKASFNTGTGGYVVGSAGGSGAIETPLDRAKRVLAERENKAGSVRVVAPVK